MGLQEASPPTVAVGRVDSARRRKSLKRKSPVSYDRANLTYSWQFVTRKVAIRFETKSRFAANGRCHERRYSDTNRYFCVRLRDFITCGSGQHMHPLLPHKHYSSRNI